MEKEITKGTIIGMIIGGIIGFVVVSVIFNCLVYLFSCII